MGSIRLYHNPRCSKSRGALEILEDRGADVEVVEYLTGCLDRADLEDILDRIPESPGELVRKDKNFEELGLDPDAYADREAVIEVLLQHPQLMQRPVALLGDRGVIARPSEKVLELLDA